VLGGCRQPSAPAPSYDAQQAREALTTALDAWKSGSLEQLARRKPPVRFSDEDLLSGAELLSYDLDSATAFGPHQDVRVDLVLRDRRGTTLNKTATYQVILEPTLAVLRNDP